MSQKRHTVDQIISKLRRADVLLQVVLDPLRLLRHRHVKLVREDRTIGWIVLVFALSQLVAAIRQQHRGALCSQARRDPLADPARGTLAARVRAKQPVLEPVPGRAAPGRSCIRRLRRFNPPP